MTIAVQVTGNPEPPRFHNDGISNSAHIDDQLLGGTGQLDREAALDPADSTAATAGKNAGDLARLEFEDNEQAQGWD